MSGEVTDKPNTKERPATRRPLAEIVADLSREIHPSRLQTKTQGGQTLTFIPWFQAVQYLDYYAPGWCYELRKVESVQATVYTKLKGPDRKDILDPATGLAKTIPSLQTSVILVARITIPAAEGEIYREASALEVIGTAGYGDAATNAESAALRRAASKFGLGLYLYDKKQRER